MMSREPASRSNWIVKILPELPFRASEYSPTPEPIVLDSITDYWGAGAL